MKKMLPIRVDEELKHTIEEQAKKAHLSTSEYIRTTLQNPTFGVDSELKPKLVAALCQHAQIANELELPIRNKLAQWEESVWQLLK